MYSNGSGSLSGYHDSGFTIRRRKLKRYELKLSFYSNNKTYLQDKKTYIEWVEENFRLEKIAQSMGISEYDIFWEELMRFTNIISSWKW